MEMSEYIDQLVEKYSSNTELVTELTKLKLLHGSMQQQYISTESTLTPLELVIRAMYQVYACDVNADTDPMKLECVDSMDRVEYIMALEDEFGIDIYIDEAELVVEMTPNQVVEWICKNKV